MTVHLSGAMIDIWLELYFKLGQEAYFGDAIFCKIRDADFKLLGLNVQIIMN